MTKRVILVADDSLVVRTMLREQLEDQGHAVIEAEDGEQALELCAEISTDVVLLDVEMPRKDGHTVLKELKADPDLREIPVVFLTARTSTEDVVEGLRIGANDYLRKPFEPSELIARVTAALRVKSLQDELRERNANLDVVSRTDSLTGLRNRRDLEEHLLAMTSASRRHGHPLAVVMIDIDHFKSINDTVGHAAGDVVLKTVAKRLHSALRVEDVIGRWGGEEFLVILPMTDIGGSKIVAERLRAMVGKEPVAATHEESLPVTISLGCAAGIGVDLAQLLERADVALYAAKAGGRDRVELDAST